MQKIQPSKQSKQPSGNTTKFKNAVTGDSILHHLAFDNSFQANIITIVSSGKIIIANAAACKLLGYSKRELLTKSRSAIFDINEKAFKAMLRQRTAEGQSKVLATVIKKNGKLIPSEITSAVFMDKDGIEKSITTIADMSLTIRKQKEIDIEKDRIVAGNIVLAKSKQKDIDIKRKGIVDHNIALAKSEQKKIDIRKEKIVTDNIDLAISNQKEIDHQKEKIVADDIALAKSEQKKIDIRKEKIVADDIDLAISNQKVIDIKREKVVAHDIVVAKSNQKKIDIKKEKIVADNIIIAQERADARLAESNEWIKYIAKASYDVMWDWDVATGDIYMGESSKEVFGYKMLNNKMSFADFSSYILQKDRERVTRKLNKALASGSKTWSDSYMFKRNDGSIASTISRASIIRNQKGKAIRLIGAIQDVSKLEDLERKLKSKVTVKIDSDDIFLQAAKLSFDGIWDWNILTNEFFLGEGFEELFGYPFNNTTNEAFDWSKHLHPDDKVDVEKGLLTAIESTATHWEDTYRFVKANGSIVDVFGRASIIRDAEGKAIRMIGAIHDLSRQKDLEERLEQEIAIKGKMLSEYKESFKLIFNSTSDVLFDSDFVADKVVISDAYEKEFGYKITNNMTPAADWASHIHPGDKERVTRDYERMLASDAIEWKCSYRFLRADNSVANVISSRIILRDADGKAYRMIGSMQDVSKQTVLEEKLELEIRLKEKQISQAAIDAKEAERSDLGRELHDNVNQLLGASKLYLDVAKRGGENSEIYLSRSSEYTLKAIEEIRKLTKGLTSDIVKNLGLGEGIDTICRDIMEVNTVRISHSLAGFDEESVNEKFKMNLFRILQEQLNNILKHAKANNVTIYLTQNKETINLTISDDGVGFDTSQKPKGIGMANIKSRAASYNGAAEFVSKPGAGCLLKITFPVTDALTGATL